ncbi:DnaT-like ssDNA-binding protein [Tateyamaria sp.]|uniref:DnaT-like ssDNA-binding protein n=1 Tax=Tateyamaria sp. TaxID=1929288 RepID=UPI003B211A34
MTLTIQQDSPISGADSYITLVSYQAHAAARGWTLTGDDAADEVNLRKAYDGINRKWQYLGDMVEYDQVSAFPRYIYAQSRSSLHVYDGTRNVGLSRRYDLIPQQVKDAQAELAFVIQGGVDIFATAGNETASTIKIGPISISDEVLPAGKDAIREVASILRPLIGVGSGQVRMARG